MVDVAASPDSDLILPVVLPPLLFAVTQRTTVTEFRRHLAAVAWLAIGLTLATAAVVAVVAHACRLSWTTAAILGAVVSPPDPVAGSLWFTSVGTELVLAVVVGC
ncbi:cation:proton antiporter domain-containing protein [Actinopolymorpha singaporensis]